MIFHFNRHIFITILALGVCIFVPTVTSCSSELVENEEMDPANRIYVAADIARSLSSRSYIESGPVEDGTFYLSYPTTSNSAYNTLPVTFNNSGSSPAIGMVSTGDPNQMFTWNMVGGGATPIFYLDNVAPNPSLGSNANTVMFDESYNPFRAGLFDDVNGTNDLLWGDKTVGRQTTNTVMFDLHHNMSRVRLQITVDKTNEIFPEDLNLENAVVSISSINQNPVSYNRLDGTLELTSEPTDNSNPYSDLIFVGNGIDWKSKVTDSNDPNITVYTTQDFVVPPQGLLDNEQRPRLTIKLNSGKEFSGILPHAMLIPDPNKPNDPELSYPVTMYFLKEHILTIRTLVSEDPPELAFLPVQVVEWVDKGEFSLEGHQAGLYLPAEFYNMISYYKTYNEYQLTRYGSLVTLEDGTTKKWNFDVFRSMTLEYDKIYNTMTVGGNRPDFQFNFNGYTVNVTKDGMTKPVNVTELHDIVTGTSTTPF
ncbi:MAG: fimbrillin family protein [Muribaculaceae bacterium]|nr:fimbrillin family protein [Muribaculaceae bacterium]